MEDKVGIIILNWNSYQVTLECINSILAISYSNYKVLVVDNGSLDNSINKLKEMINSDKVNYLQLDKNYGFTGGNNRGIEFLQKEYNPDYILLLNNDTIVHKDFLEEMVNTFYSDEKIGIVVPKIYYYHKPSYIYYAGGYINKLSGMGEHYGKGKLDEPKYDLAKEVTFANGCAFMVRKKMIKQIGYLDDNFFAINEDLDYSLRVRRSGLKIFYAPKSRIWHKEGYASKKNKGEWLRVYLTTRNIIIFQSKNLDKIFFPFFIFYFLFRWIIYMNFKFLIKKQTKCNLAIFQGIIDGVTKRLRFVG